jgi:uncharacterized protein (TIGR03067 family)
MRRIVLTLTLLSLAFAPAPFPRPERLSDSDLPKLQGTWEREAVFFWGDDGWRRSANPYSLTAVVEGNRITWRHPVVFGQASTLTLRGGTPRGIDITSDHDEGFGRCVYRLAGDALTIVYPAASEQRPKSLDHGAVKEVFRRKR